MGKWFDDWSIRIFIELRCLTGSFCRVTACVFDLWEKIVDSVGISIESLEIDKDSINMNQLKDL